MINKEKHALREKKHHAPMFIVNIIMMIYVLWPIDVAPMVYSSYWYGYEWARFMRFEKDNAKFVQ